MSAQYEGTEDLSISNTTIREQYSGSGTTGPFTVNFEFDSDSELLVVKTSSGDDTTLTLTTHYTVSGGSGSSGSVTLVSALAFGETLTITRNVPLTQTIDSNDNLERGIDKLTTQVAQLSEELDRAVKLPVSSTITDASVDYGDVTATYLFRVNAAGDGVDTVDPATALGSEFQSQDADLDAIAALSGTGFAVRSASNTWVNRTIEVGSGLDISNADGVSGNPSISLDITEFAADGSPDQTADYLLSYDTSAGSHKKVLMQDAWGGTGGPGFVTMADQPHLPNSRKLTKGVGINLDDTGGAGDVIVSWDPESLTASTSLEDADLFGFYDDSNTSPRKITYANLLTNLNSDLTIPGTTQLTQEEVEDYAGALVATGGTKTGITVTYQDSTGDMDFVVGGLTTSEFSSANISQWTNDSGYITATLTDEEVQDKVGAMFTGNTETLITATYQDADGTIDLVVDEASINHDNLTGYVANEHIDWTGTTDNLDTSGTLKASDLTLLNGGTINFRNAGDSINDVVITHSTDDLAFTGVSGAGDYSFDYNVTISGNIAVTGTVDGRDVATDGTKLDGIEAGADVTDEANVTDALDGAVLTDVGTPAATDRVLLQDASDSNNLKYADFSEFGGGGGGGGLADIVDDATPQLGGDLDTNGFNIAFDDNTGIDDDLGNELVLFQRQVSATNYIEIANGATSQAPYIFGTGSDSNVNLDLITKAAGTVNMYSTTGSPELRFREVPTSGSSYISLLGQSSLGANYTLTLPQATDTLVGKATTDTFTNKSGNISMWTNDSGYITATLAREEVEDYAGAMWTGNTETGITITYQDADGTIDAVVSDTTVAGDTGSTGITPGDTLTIAGGTEITTSMSGDTLTINADFTPSSSDTLTNKTFDANGTGNSLSNVDVADLANGTDGELITWDATGAPSTVAVGTSGHVLTSNGVGAAPTFQVASGGVSAATQAEQETGTATDVYVSPGRQQYHASAAKVWVHFTVSGGTPTVQDSYNLTSVDDDGAGLFGITFATDFGDGNYAATGAIREFGANVGPSGIAFRYGGTKATTDCDMVVNRYDGNRSDTPAAQTSVIFYGDQ